MAKAKKYTIKINWSAVARIVVGTIVMTAMYAAYRDDGANNSDSEE